MVVVQALVQSPVRSLDQRLAALERANQVRSRRAHMKTTLTLPMAQELLVEPPWWLASMKVTAFLAAIQKFGPVKTRRILRDCQISDAKTVGGLSGRQRDVLLAVLRGRAE